MAIEINNVPEDDLLTSEVPAAEFIRPQVLPHDYFGVGHIPAQHFGAGNFLASYFLSSDDEFLWHSYSPLPLPWKGRGLGG